jgi:Anti-sigma factor NepR
MNKTDKRQSASRTGHLRTDPRTSSTIRDKLGEQLRAMYGKLEEEPLPEHLLTLVRQLDQPRSTAKP